MIITLYCMFPLYCSVQIGVSRPLKSVIHDIMDPQALAQLPEAVKRRILLMVSNNQENTADTPHECAGANLKDSAKPTGIGLSQQSPVKAADMQQGQPIVNDGTCSMHVEVPSIPMLHPGGLVVVDGFISGEELQVCC